MEPRALAVVLLRILAVWIMLQSLFSVFFDTIASRLRLRYASYAGQPVAWDSYGLHDTYFVLPTLLGPAFRFAVGTVLLLTSASFAETLTRGLSDS